MYDQLASYLHEMGLSEYESDAYLALLDWGTAPAKVVSEEADIPQSRVYDVLDKIGDKGLVKVQPGRPKKFGATDPQLAIEKYCEFKERELQSKIERTRAAGKQFEQKYSSTRSKNVNCNKADIFWSYTDETRLLQEFKHLCEGATKKIRMLTEAENMTRKLNQHKEILSAQDQEGVDIQVLLANSNAVSDVIMDRLTECAEVRLTEAMGGQLYIGDTQSVLIAFRDPTGEGYLGLTIENRDVGYTLSQLFDSHWTSAREQEQPLSRQDQIN
jgi:sugar-specific transcriptional regulator TrmB